VRLGSHCRVLTQMVWKKFGTERYEFQSMYLRDRFYELLFALSHPLDRVLRLLHILFWFSES
jgi:hypothetical protein